MDYLHTRAIEAATRTPCSKTKFSKYAGHSSSKCRNTQQIFKAGGWRERVTREIAEQFGIPQKKGR